MADRSAPRMSAAPAEAAPQGPLAGLRVLDLSRVLAAPWATQILGDLGAEVLKVEQPGSGDDTRRWGPPFLDDGSERPDAAYFLCANRNKRSIAIDFARPEGAALVRRLAAGADILVENFRTGGLAKYGLDAATLCAAHPRLVYCSITGFGQTGPYAARGGYDFLIQGLSGLMSVTGRPDGAEGAGPMKVGLPVSDLFTGLYATISILAALRERERSGLGQHLDCALLDSQLAVLVNQGMNYLVGGTVPGRLGNDHPNVVPYRDFAAADDYIIVACGNDAQFRALCRLLGLGAMAEDPRFATNAGRMRERRTLELALARAIAPWKAAELLAAMERAGVPGGPINTIDQVLADPQVAARGLLRSLCRADGTPLTVIGYPGQFSRTPPSYRHAPPWLGQDTAEILSGLLGLDAAEIEALKQAGVVQAATRQATEQPA
ncbi:CaiB/BaiF CoA transferase family protein [Teichococcus cervicalis]|uniref:CoA-transferase family III protein n=1 Tax=Pseudoroseomonas cervicalis ATCC 49957 TaxID=525371 RepID=D5RPT2_9PROT|nr:CaiB/BaiF CoA-transferase family protein [Pseudoroseomonas cervicalis]EFH10709.1 CoA-transferase family III protein [Pseudoroseomonas cervicalis ATCC 49957]